MYSESDGLHVPKIAYATANGTITCKDCNGRNENISESMVVTNIVKTLKIKCIYSGYGDITDEGIELKTGNDKGCEWVGVTNEFNGHINECEFMPILCEYCKKYKGIKKKLMKHYDICGSLLIDCELKCNNKIERSKMENHIRNECSNYLVLCGNKGCNVKIKRIQYDDHVSNLCEYKQVICPYKKYGCDMDGLNKQTLSKHLKNNKMMHYLIKIDFDNNDLRKKLNELESKLNHLSQYEPILSIENADENSIILLIDNDNNNQNIMEYKIEYTKIPFNVFYNKRDKNFHLKILNKLYDNDDEKTEWNSVKIKYDKNKKIQKYRHILYMNLMNMYLIQLIYLI